MATPPQIRTLVLSALVSGGCVVPVAPQFDDLEQNYPPFVVTSSPSEGDVFTQGTSTQDREIAVTLSDHNLHDHLSVRWLLNYPGANMNTSRPIREDPVPPSGMLERATLRIQPGCDKLGLSPGLHRLTMSVSDRRFLDALKNESVSPEAPLDTPADDGNRIRVIWMLNCL